MKAEKEIKEDLIWIKQCIEDIKPSEDRWDKGYKEALEGVLGK